MPEVTAPKREMREHAPTLPPHLAALRGLFLISMHYGCHLSPEQVADATSHDDLAAGMVGVFKSAGFRAQVHPDASWPDMLRLGSAFPVLAEAQDGSWLIVAGILGEGEKAQVAVLDPARETLGLILLSSKEFGARWNNRLILCKRSASGTELETNRFGLLSLVPTILQYGNLLRDVAIAALGSSLIALATPLLYHVIIDRVIPFHARQTLLTVLIVFGLTTVFDGVFSYARARLMLNVTNKIDAKLASDVFRKLLSLPLPFFEQHPAGVLVRHLQQTERLRHFLTGRLFSCAFDSAMLPLLLVLMCVYSFALTLLVFAFAACIAAIVFGLIPFFRARLNRLYQSEGARQAHLVETLHGIRTIKSLALERKRQQDWDERLAAAISSHASVGAMSAGANTLTAMLDRLMQISIVGIGAESVFSGRLSIGALVAFTMFASRVSAPLLQIVGLINEYQETALSVRMLGTVLDATSERESGQSFLRPNITGDISIEDVTFKYVSAATPSLERVTFSVQEGAMIGIVGRSGSGKSTLIRLLQGIEVPQSGLVRLSGVDIRHIDLQHLRRSTGVVLQDSFLFRGTLRDNIAASRPNASLAEVVAAARLAGAEEFIERLPLGYDTMIEEGAVNFSGGQKQRLSIARALLPQPKLLIFDEATSALDPESEAILQANLKQIAAGRTVIVVSHRLSSLVQADRILMLERGQVLDYAPHKVLLNRCLPYRSLWDQQTQHVAA